MTDNVDDIESLLNGLRQMQTTNPEVFKQAMQSLGLPVTDGETLLDDPASLTKMAESIKMMRAGDSMGDAGKDVLLSKNAAKQPKGISITPRPGFSFKTTRMSDQIKVFVNMAEHEAIDEPALKKKLDDSGEEVEGMNIPMSVGAPVWSVDKKGAKCIVYDIIVNPIVITESVADKTGKYRDFICQLGMQYLEQKYKEELDKRYKLPKLKYLGDTVASQMIQDRKNMPKIEEVSSSKSASAGSKGKSSTQGTGKVVEVEVVDKDMVYSIEWLSTSFNGVSQPSASSVLSSFAAGALAEEGGRWLLQSYTHQSTEYLDPIFEPDDKVLAIVISADINSYDLNVAGLSVLLSPYKVAVKAPGYKKTTIHLACAISPAESHYTLRRPYEGCVSAVRIQLVLRVDRADWALSADAGSKAWLLAQALSAEEEHGEERNPYSYATAEGATRGSTVPISVHSAADGGAAEVFAEDRFHLNLPEDVDQYTGVKLDGSGERSELPAPKTVKSAKTSSTSAVVPEEEQEFAEDRFHKKDAASAYLINQREQAKRDKWAKHEKEKAERANDPNVEYVDMEDFRVGGKYGPAEKAAPAAMAEPQNEELRRAAEVVAASASQQGCGGLQLSSALWTELLD